MHGDCYTLQRLNWIKWALLSVTGLLKAHIIKPLYSIFFPWHWTCRLKNSWHSLLNFIAGLLCLPCPWNSDIVVFLSHTGNWSRKIIFPVGLSKCARFAYNKYFGWKWHEHVVHSSHRKSSTNLQSTPVESEVPMHWVDRQHIGLCLAMFVFADVFFLCRVDGDCLSHQNHAVEYILLLNTFQVCYIFTC